MTTALLPAVKVAEAAKLRMHAERRPPANVVTLHLLATAVSSAATGRDEAFINVSLEDFRLIEDFYEVDDKPSIAPGRERRAIGTT